MQARSHFALYLQVTFRKKALLINTTVGEGLENDEGAILVMQGDGNLVRYQK